MARTHIYAPDGCAIGSIVRRATTAGTRLRGLIGGPPLSFGEALLLVPAKQVHTFGMTYRLDILFCDAEWRVAHLLRSLPPNRCTRVVGRARYVLEMPAGSIPDGVAAGDQLSLRDL